MAYVLLALVLLAGIALVPLGLPGTWLQLAALAGYGWYTGFTTVGVPTLTIVAVLVVLAEVLEWTVGARYARKYGGGRRAEWGAVIGGIVGAMVGVPVFIIGSVIGAFLGAFAGAALFELLGQADWRSSVRVGWGALIGRVAAAAIKSAISAAIAAIGLVSALG